MAAVLCPHGVTQGKVDRVLLSHSWVWRRGWLGNTQEGGYM